MKYLPKEKTPESLYNKALRAFKNIQNDNGKFVICLYQKMIKYLKWLLLANIIVLLLVTFIPSISMGLLSLIK